LQTSLSGFFVVFAASDVDCDASRAASGRLIVILHPTIVAAAVYI